MILRRARWITGTTLRRLPGRHGFSLLPWIVPLLFGLAGTPVSTEGPDEGAWIRIILIAHVAAWLAQGLVLLIVRRRAMLLPPTVRGGVITLAVFATIGAVGGVVQATVLAPVALPDPPQFISPATLVLFSILTWVCTAGIIAFAFSWRDQLADSLRASEQHAELTRQALGRSLHLEAYRHAVVARLLRERTLPRLRAIRAELESADATGPQQPLADALERLARDDIRSASHLLHPVTAAESLPAAVAAVCRPFGVHPVVTERAPSPELPADAVDHAALTAVELLLDTKPTDPPSSLTVTIDANADNPAIELRYGRGARVPIGHAHEQALVPLRTPRWYQIAPAPHGMPWVAIALLNAFSVLAATLAAGTGLWLAALADMVVITTGTAGLDRLLRWSVIQRLSARGQWIVIASVVAAIGALAGGVWGTLIGGETASLAVLGLVCALSMGLFLPGIRVWASEIRRLRAAIVLDDLATEAKVIRQRVRSLTAAKAAAESLHATVQSQLLGVAGAIGSDVPPELRALALSTLDGVVEAALPAITNQLEAAPVAEDTPLLDATALSTVWPLVDISMEVPSELPPVALTLLNSVIVEAVGNAVQHGQADAVTVEATLWPGALAITVEDDGIGVPPQARDGLGLTAIRSVASEFSLLPRPRGGTRLDLRLPFLA
jgi:hypothetical protein